MISRLRIRNEIFIIAIGSMLLMAVVIYFFHEQINSVDERIRKINPAGVIKEK